MSQKLPTDLADLKRHLEGALSLLDDPQIGLSSWWLLLAERLKEVKVLL